MKRGQLVQHCSSCCSTKQAKHRQEDDNDVTNRVESNMMRSRSTRRREAVVKCMDCQGEPSFCVECFLVHQSDTSNSKTHRLVRVGDDQQASFSSSSSSSDDEFEIVKEEDTCKNSSTTNKLSSPSSVGHHASTNVARLAQIEADITKTFGFYEQTLRERKDYLLKEMNTVAQYAVLSHSQSLAKHLQTQFQLDMKKQTTESELHSLYDMYAEYNKKIEQMQADLDANTNNNNTNNGCVVVDVIRSNLNVLNDMVSKIENDVKRTLAELKEIGDLVTANNQLIEKCKSTDPLASLEFISSYSAIQTSVRNTFGYIRISQQAQSQQMQKLQQQQQQNEEAYTKNISMGNQYKELSIMCDMNAFNGSSNNNGLNETPNLFSNNSQSTSSSSGVSTSCILSPANSAAMASSSNTGDSFDESPTAAALRMSHHHHQASDHNQSDNDPTSKSKHALSHLYSNFITNNPKLNTFNYEETQNNHFTRLADTSQQQRRLSNASLISMSAGVVNRPASIQQIPQLNRSKMIYHCKFGEFGINDGQFTEPSGVTIMTNPNGNGNVDIVVADTNSHRIQIFDKDGAFRFKFGECGKRDGQLLYPNRVAVCKQTGDIVVTERSPTHQIQIYNRQGKFVRKFGANILQHPRGVYVDYKSRIVVVECKVMRVIVFDLYGNVLNKFSCSKYLEFPNGVCCSNPTNPGSIDREEIYISDNRAHCIKVFDYHGNYLRQIGGEGITNYPIGVGINANNEILVADNHNNFNLTVFTQDGRLINALESKVKHAQCFDVGLMDDGSIVLASKDYRIYVYKYTNTLDFMREQQLELTTSTTNTTVSTSPPPNLTKSAFYSNTTPTIKTMNSSTTTFDRTYELFTDSTSNFNCLNSNDSNNQLQVDCNLVQLLSSTGLAVSSQLDKENDHQNDQQQQHQSLNQSFSSLNTPRQNSNLAAMLKAFM